MDAAAIVYPSTLVTTPTGETTIPAPLRRYRPKFARPSEIKGLRRLPELTVVWTREIDALLSHRSFLRTLAERLTATPEPSKIVFLFQMKKRKASERETAQKLVELFAYFTRPVDLEVAQGIQAGEDAFNEAVAKIVATRHLSSKRIERADHLSELKKVIEATNDLRAQSGKLSANKVASVFGLSVAELAALVGEPGKQRRRHRTRIPSSRSCSRSNGWLECARFSVRAISGSGFTWRTTSWTARHLSK
jgi:hypothetical protein